MFNTDLESTPKDLQNKILLDMYYRKPSIDLSKGQIRPWALVKVIDLFKVAHIPEVEAREVLPYGVN